MPLLERQEKDILLNKISRMSLQQNKAIKALDELRINKDAILCDMTMIEFLECKENAQILYDNASNRINSIILKVSNKDPELLKELLPYLNLQYTTKH